MLKAQTPAAIPRQIAGTRRYRNARWALWALAVFALALAHYLWPLRRDALCADHNGCVLWQDNRFFFSSIWGPALGAALFAVAGAFFMSRNRRAGIVFGLLALPFFAWEVGFFILLSNLHIRN
jgi:hypothetical protein